MVLVLHLEQYTFIKNGNGTSVHGSGKKSRAITKYYGTYYAPTLTGSVFQIYTGWYNRNHKAG